MILWKGQFKPTLGAEAACGRVDGIGEDLGVQLT